MEYRVTTKIEIPTFLSCKNCKLWSLVGSKHICTRTVDTTIYNHKIIWSMT